MLLLAVSPRAIGARSRTDKGMRMEENPSDRFVVGNARDGESLPGLSATNSWRSPRDDHEFVALDGSGPVAARRRCGRQAGGMDYTRLGTTGLQVSRICLGMMSFGEPDRGNHPWSLPEEDSRRIIGKALA